MSTGNDSLLKRVSAVIARTGYTTGAGRKSILSQAASCFAKRPSGTGSTVPTGFDPKAAVLFEAVVEAAFLVANADGVFDEAERRAFETVVTEGCTNTVQPEALHSLVSDLCDRLAQEGMDWRVQAVAAAVVRPAHRLEVLRIAALMAHVSEGVAGAERDVLEQLARRFGLGPDAVPQALDQAEQALHNA